MIATAIFTLTGMIAGQAFGAFVASKRDEYFKKVSDVEIIEDINSSIEEEEMYLESLKRAEQEILKQAKK